MALAMPALSLSPLPPLRGRSLPFPLAFTLAANTAASLFPVHCWALVSEEMEMKKEIEKGKEKKE